MSSSMKNLEEKKSTIALEIDLNLKLEEKKKKLLIYLAGKGVII